ncbi:MAG TPA: alpha/beta hydrolase-fold protein [Acidobacteriaceae bacterium]|nr:alpha/beta hydrolase-fold protein [Acidobacteriaceae bacterium]
MVGDILAPMRRILSLVLMLAALPAFAQDHPPFDSHEVNSNGAITFRYQNAAASRVTVDTDAAPDPLVMQKDSSGLWTVTTKPLPAEHYGYSFVVDGVTQLDPLNHTIRPNLVGLYSDVLVPGKPPAPWELTQIPHGNVTRHMLTTFIAHGLPMDQEPYFVYTPPNYDPRHKGGYPVLYLLHGWSDYGDGWLTVGKADLMLDSLISTGSIVPMIVVMPQGYGDYSFVTSGHTVWDDQAKVIGNLTLYSKMLMQEIVPAVERDYPIARGRDNHAIAGLSMGGLESLTIGVNHADYFAYVGGFSSAVKNLNFKQQMMDPGMARNLRVLWVACGASDDLITPNRNFVNWAKAQHLPVTAIETEGKHTWLVWRENFIHFTPLLFRQPRK